MLSSLTGFLKGLLLQDPADRSKQLSIQISSSATPGTSTTVIAAQTSNQTILFPDTGSTSTLVTAESPEFTDAITLTQIATPSTPASGTDKIYVKSDDQLYILDSTGTEFQISGSLTNPMTTGGDIIYGGSGGNPLRLANGTATQVLTSAGGTAAPTWANSFQNPMSAPGQMIAGTTSGAPIVVAAGTSGQALISTGASTPTFQTIPGNTTVLHIPTIQRFTTGSGTYNRPSSPSPLYLKIRIVGGGGGGGSNAGIGGAGSVGADTSFGPILSHGGEGGTNGGRGLGGVTNGAATLVNAAGNSGTIGPAAGFGGNGGASLLGEGAQGTASSAAPGSSGSANSGGGGGGGGGTISPSGGGGGAGAYAETIITSPNATYSYAVGAGGAGGTAGTSGGNTVSAGGTGGSGLIIVEEHYQ